MRIIIISLCLIALSAFEAQSQSAFRKTTSNQNAWLMYFGNHKFSEKWGWHAEAQLRRHDFLSDDQQLLLRTGIEHYFTNGNRLTAGYAFIHTHPYGEFGVPQAFPEHRIWQQFLTAQAFGKFKLNHRYRLEQRFIGNAVTGEMEGGRYENRFRYMFKATYALSDMLFLAAYDEVFLNFGKEVGFNLFDQNRAYGALGFNLAKNLKAEVGYLYQAVQLRALDTAPTPRARIENNHTLQAAIFFSVPFYSVAD